MFFLAAVALMATACSKAVKDSDINGKGGYPDLAGLTVDGQFPIVAWTGIDAEDTGRKFGPMKESGVNVYLGWYDTMDEVRMALDNAQAAGVKLIIKSNELVSDTRNTVGEMMSHPALFAYHIEDEPNESEFPVLAETVSQISAIDSSHPCYINLYPNWAWGEIDGYMSKVLQFLAEVNVRFLSFDCYPIYVKNGVSYLRPYWYKNLEDIRRVARSRNIPFWAFALALSHRLDDEVSYPIPTVEELRLQMFINLAYGAQGFQYFTWWGVYQDGPTQVYDMVKTVNAELQALSIFFLGADVTDVWHTGKEIPYGTKKLDSMPSGLSSLSTSDGGAVVSRVVKDGKVYIAVVNKDYQKPMSLDISFSSRAVQIDHNGYKAEAVPGRHTVGAGDIIMFQIL